MGQLSAKSWENKESTAVNKEHINKCFIMRKGIRNMLCFYLHSKPQGF